ncbi:ATP-binding protein [Lacimonas salitolerans]|uniref:histidine kinase n=1 Tax=Lacimonas salitolerans TaxID=1323750 RepID=A0ABW4EHV8_9RHOB
MKGSDCLVLDTGTAPEGMRFARDTLAGHVVPADVSLSDLQGCNTQPGAEMGVLIVPFGQGCNLDPVARAVARCRAQGVHIAVLGLAADNAQAAQVPLGDLFDMLVSMDWAAASEIIRRFVDNRRTDLQNRALKTFLEESVDGYWMWHVESDVVEWSRRTSDMVGLPHEKAPTKRDELAALVHPSDHDRVKQAINNHLELGTPYKNIELRFHLGDNRYGHFLANGQALRDDEGKPIIIVGSLTDRTLMQQVERQLEDTQRRFTVLFHHMNDAAILADAVTGTILEANQPAERLWGKPIAELVGMHQSELHPPRVSDQVRQGFADHVAALMRNKRDTTHAPILCADGTELLAEISGSLIEIDGQTAILGVFRDISDRVRIEHEARARDAQIQLSSHMATMGTMAAGVAHEINNPLTYVLGNLERIEDLLRRDGTATPEIAEALEGAATGGRYVREIVADLKAISRVDGSENACDPAEVIRIASRMAMSDLRHRAQLDMALGQVPHVPIAPGRLSQVMLNLLSNAAHAFQSEDRGQNGIGIDVSAAGDRVRIVVEDNGVGIPPDDLARLFEPFFTRRGESGGTGLGLPICRRILAEADGTLEITSTPGQGTRVEITLPALADRGEAGTVAQAAARRAAGAARPRVMVVDDDVLVTTLVARMLEDAFDITVFNDARRALEALRAGQGCDIILCDIMMPDMDGPAFCTAVGPDGPPFLFLTGGAVTAHSIAFERRMASEGRLMHKPFDTSDLRRKLQHMVRGGAGASGPRASGPTAGLDAAGRPEPDILSELEALLGRAGVCRQMETLAAQVQGLADGIPGLSPEALAAEAHRVAGAADVMGLRVIGGQLRGCQQAAARGDLACAREAMEAVRPMLRAFKRFVSGYCPGGSGHLAGPRA